MNCRVFLFFICLMCVDVGCIFFYGFLCLVYYECFCCFFGCYEFVMVLL